MGRLFGFVGLLIAVAVGAYLYSQQAKSSIGGTNAAAPTATLNVIGVQNDLLALANAERSHLALEGKYASLDELLASKDISTKPNRGSCTYDSSVREMGFTITATCPNATPSGAAKVFSIDETMQIHSD